MTQSATPSVSVVIPTHNRANVLAATLDSVCQQTAELYEIIVVDDASSDDTEALVRSYPQVRYLRSDVNLGAAGARNLGAEAARGDFIAFQDSDDLWLPTRVEEQLRKAVSEPEVALWLTGVAVLWEQGGGDVFAVGDAAGFDPRQQLLRGYEYGTSTWMIRRSVFNHLGGFDQTFPNSEDWEFVSRLFSSGYELRLVPKLLVIKNNCPDSLDAVSEKTAKAFQLMSHRYDDLWLTATTKRAQIYRRMMALNADIGNREAMLDAEQRFSAAGKAGIKDRLVASLLRYMPGLYMRLRQRRNGGRV